MTNHGNNAPWPKPQVETLKTLWAEGKSASEIAKVLPGRSRCSVIAKVHRLGLSGRGMPESLARRAPTAPEVKQDRQTGAIPLMERRRFQCAWPVGEPERPAQQMCCGLPVQEGVGTALESYCATHQQRAASAYQPVRREIKAPAEYRRAAAKPAPSSIWDEARVA